jgi:hypothetical protein
MAAAINEQRMRGITVPVVASERLDRAHVQGSKDKSVDWAGAFATCGGHGAVQSSTIVYEIEPGGHLGWHSDATEETQYIIAGSGELRMANAPSDRAACSCCPRTCATTSPTPVRRRCAVAFFAAAMFMQNFDEVMPPPKTNVLGTPNRNG